jgi:hypothetical protein
MGRTPPMALVFRIDFSTPRSPDMVLARYNLVRQTAASVETWARGWWERESNAPLHRVLVFARLAVPLQRAASVSALILSISRYGPLRRKSDT